MPRRDAKEVRGRYSEESLDVGEEIIKTLSPDDSGITVQFTQYYDIVSGPGTYVTFKIPDHAKILSRDPHQFMRWCFDQMMEIANQSKRVGR